MTPILHITNVANLAGVLQHGGLWSQSHMPPAMAPHSSAHASIQQHRARIQVNAGPRGVLHDYVPFYFGARSPMLYANHRGYVEGNDGGQRRIVYLVSTVEVVAASSCDWVFTDGHAIITKLTQFFDQLANLSKVDWHTVHAQFGSTRPRIPIESGASRPSSSCTVSSP